MLKFTVTQDKITPSLKKKFAELSNLPLQAFTVWLGNTPIRTGNARRRTNLLGNTIRADYNYAVPLDQGRSKQAPQGMVKPTERYLVRRLRQIFGGKI